MPTAPGTAPPRRQCNKLAGLESQERRTGRVGMLRSNAFDANAIFFHATTILAFLVPAWENPTAIQHLPLAKFNSSRQPHRSSNRVIPNGFPQRMQGQGSTTHHSTDSGLRLHCAESAKAFKNCQLHDPATFRNRFAFANIHGSCTKE